MDKIASKSNKIKIILVAVDDFSRFVKFQTMKTKSATDLLQVFTKNDFSKKILQNFFVLIKSKIW